MHGGKRERAGRKPKSDRPKIKITITIDPDLIEQLGAATDNKSEYIEKLIRRSLLDVAD